MHRDRRPRTDARPRSPHLGKHAKGGRKLKGKTMKISRIALLAGLGMVALTLPAAAAPVTTDGTDVRAAKPAYMQLAQMNATRAASEARGGDFKKAKKSKKKGKTK
jgi:hypothetical protein